MAHALKPTVLIGQKGVTPEVMSAIDEALALHELIKIKFTDVSERNQKNLMIGEIEVKAACEFVGMTGHVAIIFRHQNDPEKRKIQFPER